MYDFILYIHDVRFQHFRKYLRHLCYWHPYPKPLILRVWPIINKMSFVFVVCLQEMDEHMRSMLHHRELEKLKGRWVVANPGFLRGLETLENAWIFDNSFLLFFKILKLLELRIKFIKLLLLLELIVSYWPVRLFRILKCTYRQVTHSETWNFSQFFLNESLLCRLTFLICAQKTRFLEA